MEIIPTLMLWLCMPLDRTPPWPTVEDRGMFPPIEVIERERDRSWEAHLYCCRQYSRTGWKVEYWRTMGRKTADEFNAWNELYYAHYWDNDAQNAAVLKLLRDRLGFARYYAGQMPAPVRVPEMPPRKAGEK